MKAGHDTKVKYNIRICAKVGVLRSLRWTDRRLDERRLIDSALLFLNVDTLNV